MPPAMPPAIPDVDMDGIPDYREQAFAGSSTGMDVPADSDGDTALDLEEVRAATDPMDRNSVLVIENISIDGTTIILNWQSASGKVYRWMGASSILDGFHQIGPSVPATPPNNVESVSDPS